MPLFSNGSTNTCTVVMQVLFNHQTPGMVANKTKSTTTPAGLHGHIWHQSLISRVSNVILSAGLLWLLPHTPQQNRPLRQYFTGRALTGHEAVTASRRDIYIYIISSSSNDARGLFNSSLQASSGKRAKPASGLFSLWRMKENAVDFGVVLFLFITGVKGPVIFYWAYGWRFDSSGAVLTLMSTPSICLSERRLWHRRYVQYLLYIMYNSTRSWETT